MHRFKKIGVIASLVATMTFSMIACSSNNSEGGNAEIDTIVASNEASQKTSTAKYIFMFIGDGMSYPQVNGAQIYNGTVDNEDSVELTRLGFTEFPVTGSASTQDSTSFAPDSASTATSIASGVKTHSGVIGLEADKTTEVTTIAEQLKEKGYKVGIVSTVTLNHATPAAFYANVESRNSYYDIALQMADSDFDYFAGGELGQPTGKDKDQRDIYEILEEKGYTVTRDKDEILSLDNESGKVYAINPELVGGAMEYSIDMDEDSLKLSDLVSTGINVLDNEEGFFMMVESGKVDWAGHANDAMSNIKDVVAFDEAISEAVKFYNEHPDETLIIVTGDHETGGMTLGQATTGYDTAFDLLSNQKMSYEAFDEVLKTYLEANPNASFDDTFSLVTENFGLLKEGEDNNLLVLTEYELNKVKAAYEETLKPAEKRATGEEATILYGGYEPLTVTLTHILNNKAGIGWTSYSHTGLPVPVYAIGAGAEEFNGFYDNNFFLQT